MIESIDECIFLSFLVFYVIWKAIRVPGRVMGFLKGRKRGIAAFFFVCSVLLQSIYSILLATVGNFLDIDRDDLELLGKVEKTMMVSYLGYDIDLVKFMQLSLIFSRLLRTSVLFWLVNFLDAKSKYFTISRNVRLFCNFYGILRIPMVFFFERYVELNELSEKFVRSLFFGSEIYFACFLILIGGLREYKGHNLVVMMFVVLADTIIRYTMNILVLPFEMTSIMYHVLLKVLFVSMFTINILIANIVLARKQKSPECSDDLRVNGAVVEYNNYGVYNKNDEFMV